MIVVIGTSGKVIPLDNLVNHISYSVLNNAEPSQDINDALFDEVFFKNATQAIDEIKILIENFLKTKG
jgi:NAD-dependent SIR2 family protein deacetylase